MTWADLWELRDLKLSKPLPLMPSRKLRIEAKQLVDQGHLDIEIASVDVAGSRAGSGEAIVHCTCHAIFQSDAAMLSVAPDEADAAAGYCVNDLYAQLADGGFDYGRQFQLVQSAHRGATSWGGRADTPLARGELQRRAGAASAILPLNGIATSTHTGNGTST